MTQASRYVYRLPHARWSLLFCEAALQVFRDNAQRRIWSRESVGQLYSRDLTQQEVVVDVATRLKPTFSAWSRVRFDPDDALAEREKMFEQGLHCVGLWHTHPEPIPSPSGEDRELARDYAVAASSLLSGVIFVIVGTAPVPGGLGVWVDDTEFLRKMTGKAVRPHAHAPAA
jgi:proteasome lid subunit RPN8/RPN11